MAAIRPEHDWRSPGAELGEVRPAAGAVFGNLLGAESGGVRPAAGAVWLEGRLLEVLSWPIGGNKIGLF